MQAPKVYLLYWLPKGVHFDASGAAGDFTYMSTIASFFADASAGTYLNIASEYPGMCSPPTIPTSQSCFGTATTSEFVYLDTRPYPHAGTVADPLQDADIQQEVTNFLNQSNVVPSLNTEFFVFTGANINECASFGCTFNAFCAYHGNYRLNNNPVIYAYMPNVAALGCLNIAKTPNLQSADYEILVASHEFVESMTDPLIAESSLGWYDFNNGEIGDICVAQTGPLNADGSNVSLNGHPYVVQELWDNDGAACALAFSPALTGRTAEITSTTGATALAGNSSVSATFRESHGTTASSVLHAANQDPAWNTGTTYAKVYAQPSLGTGYYQWTLSDVDFGLVAGAGSPTQWPIESVTVKLRNPNGSFECEPSGTGSPLGTTTTSTPFPFATPACEPAPASLTVRKILIYGLSTDRFNLQIDGKTVAANINQGSTGALVQGPGAHTVSETAGTLTNLANFTTIVDGDCTASGSVTLAPGDNKNCTVTNVGRLNPSCPVGDKCCEVSGRRCVLCVRPGEVCP